MLSDALFSHRTFWFEDRKVFEAVITGLEKRMRTTLIDDLLLSHRFRNEFDLTGVGELSHPGDAGVSSIERLFTDSLY